MAEHKRSSDGTRETRKILGARGTVSQSGRKGGDIARNVGTKDELKRAYERPAGPTRVSRTKEQED